MSIRSRLVLLVLAVLVPAVLASLAGMAYIYKERERSVERSLLEMSRALSLVVDSEIERRDALLMVLAATPTLATESLVRFDNLMKETAKASGTRLFLLDGNGVPLLSSEENEALDWRMPEEVLAGATDNSVSDIYLDQNDQLSFALVESTTAHSGTRYFVAMVVPIHAFQELFSDFDLPRGWTGAILDRSARIVARNRNPHLHVGLLASADVVAKLAVKREGLISSTTRDGTPVLAAFNRAPGSSWSFVVGVPEEDVNHSAADALKMQAGVAILLLAAAILLSIRFCRTILVPLRTLTLDASALGRGERVASSVTGLQEIDVVSASLAAASEQIRSATETMENRVAEAVAASERSQATLLQSQKLEALGRLTGGIAHDFNNLLQTLSTGLHLADRLSTNHDAQTAISSCKRAVGRAAKLTRQLMAFGRSQVSEARRVDVRDQLLAMEDLLKGALRSNIELSFDLAEDLWPVHVDPLQLELAILNLSINARDATPGTGLFRISAANLEVDADQIAQLAAGQYVQLSFQDSGEGMSEEVMEKALDPFFTTKPAGKGSGLGLAQIYGFTKQAGGSVAISSREGEGTKVTLFLPRSAGEQEQVLGTSPSPNEEIGRNAVVLIVEDDVLVRDVLTPALKAHGFQVLAAGDAGEALELLSKHPVDIVFSDIVMPGSMNGVSLAVKIREDYPAIPVVLATGYSEDAAVPSDIRIIGKPYEIPAVVVALREALAQ
jgi:signal transduction histidine kinase